MFGLAASRWTAGTPLGAALVEVIREVQTVGGGRLNMLAVDGRGIAGTTYGERLFVLEKDTGIAVASEPYDDDPDWVEVPEGVLVEAGEHGLTLTPAGATVSPAQMSIRREACCSASILLADPAVR